MALECVLLTSWLWLIVGAITVAVLVYAVASSIKKQPNENTSIQHTYGQQSIQNWLLPILLLIRQKQILWRWDGWIPHQPFLSAMPTSSCWKTIPMWWALSRCAKYSASAQRPATASCGMAKSVVSKSAEPIVFRRLIFSRFSASVAEKQSRRNAWTQFVYKKCSAEVLQFEPGSGIIEARYQVGVSATKKWG